MLEFPNVINFSPKNKLLIPKELFHSLPILNMELDIDPLKTKNKITLTIIFDYVSDDVVNLKAIYVLDTGDLRGVGKI